MLRRYRPALGPSAVSVTVPAAVFGDAKMTSALLLGSLLGFVTSAFPDLLGLIRDGQDRKHELAILHRQMEQMNASAISSGSRRSTSRPASPKVRRSTATMCSRRASCGSRRCGLPYGRRSRTRLPAVRRRQGVGAPRADRRRGAAAHRGVAAGNGEELLSIDVMMAEPAVLRLIRVPLTDGQFSALTSFVFNVGAGARPRRGSLGRQP